MDKLRKYIQECGGDIVYSDYDKVATLEDLEYNYRYIRFLLSTEAMFIKWLVENDKINKSKVFSFIDTADKPYEDILCLLALSDEPINDLISFLKDE